MSTLAAMTFGGLLLVAAADQPPTLNIGPTCAGTTVELRSGQCEKSEHDARNKLQSEWSKFHAGDRRECVTLTNIGGFPSYVQVLTCLEVARDARQAPRG